MIRGWLALALVLGLAGCGWLASFTRGEDNLPPPTPLQPIDSQVQPQQQWALASGADSREQLVRLRPMVDAESIYVAGFNGEVVAVERDSGRVRWRQELSGAVSGGVGAGGATVLTGGPAGQVWALEREGGEVRWESMVSTEVLSPPEGRGNVVVVRAVDGSVHGLDSIDGSHLWTYSSSEPALTLRGNSPLLLVSGAAIVGLDNGKVAVIDTSSGRAYWERTIAPPTGRSELDRMVDIDAAPVLIGSVLYVATYQGQLVALDVEAGRALWTRDLSTYTGLAADERNVYVSDADGNVLAFDRRSGASMWLQDALAHRNVTGPAIHGGFVVVGDLEGYLHWLDPATGELVGRARLGEQSIVVAPVAAGGQLYAIDVAGVIAAYDLP